MPENFPSLKTEKLWLRQLIPIDIENVFQGLSNADVIKYYGVSYKDLIETEDQMKWFKDLEENGTGVWWAITSAKDQEFYGALGFNNLSVAHRKAEIGFWLMPKYWGKGIMKNAVNLVCSYGFEQINLHRIEAMVETENKNCKNLMHKLGFEHEGTMHECEIKNGEFISLDIYAKLY